MVCRGDVFGAFAWSGTSALSSLTDPTQKWRQVATLSGLGIAPGTAYGGFTTYPYEYVQAPGNSNYHYLMLGSKTGGTFTIWYSTDKGFNWTQAPGAPAVPLPSAGLQEAYKIAVDPNNEKIAYWTLASNAGASAGVYTTFDRTLGHTWPTFSAAGTDSTTLFPNCTTATGGGIAFDTSMGTTTINGQVVTKRIILCVGGHGIYETTDGGVNWTEIAVSAFGSSAFHVVNGGFDGNFATNVNGVNNYFCSTPELSKIWRYVGGGSSGWSNILGTSGYNGALLIIDSRPGFFYLTKYGNQGSGVGHTTTNSTASPPTWGGATGGQTPVFKGASYDLPWVQYLFGQGSFTNGVFAAIDQNGTCFWCGNQSIWYYDSIPNFAVSLHTVSNSFGRGSEGTVSCDVLVPIGSNTPIMACQDLGAPMLGNSFVSYPTDMVRHSQETLASTLEFAASDSNFIISRMTGQVGSTLDVSSYSADAGKTWTLMPTVPTSLWQSTFNGSTSAGVLTVTSFITGNIILPGTQMYQNNSSGAYLGAVQPYGTNGTTGTGGTGTYALTTSSPNISGTIYAGFLMQSGQAVAVDHNNFLMIPTGQNSNGLVGGGQYSIPVHTTDAGNTWAFCQQAAGGNMPAARWSSSGSWQGGDRPKTMAVGYGTDLGTVWIVQYDVPSLTLTLWRSTDSGATFTSIGSQTCNTTSGSAFIHSMPGYPNELWMGCTVTGGTGNYLWHVTNANTASATFTAMTGTNLPSGRPLMLNFGIGAGPGGGYPYIYGMFIPTGVGGVPGYLYQGTWNGTTISWSLYGPAGADQGANTQKPSSLGCVGAAHIIGDWNVPGRLFTSGNGTGFAYYNP